MALSSTGALRALLPALARLDALLERALAAAPSVHGENAVADPERGLDVSEEEALRVLRREPGATLFGPPPSEPWPDGEATPLDRLRRELGLSDFDADVLLLALAVELDRRYERVYAYLQDDVLARRPTVDLALHLLCATAVERIERRERFGAGAPLLHHGVVRLVDDPRGGEPTLLGSAFAAEPWVVRLLLAEPGVDPRLLGALHRGPAPQPSAAAIPDVIPPATLLLTGAEDTERREAAAAVAARLGRELVELDAGVIASGVDPLDTVRLAVREACFRDTVLLLAGAEALFPAEPAGRAASVAEALSELPAVLVLGARGLPAAGTWERVLPAATPVRLAAPDAAARHALWAASLADAGAGVPDADVAALASRFRLGARQIRSAVTAAVSANAGAPDLFAAARAQAGQGLAQLAARVPLGYDFGDLVLPADQLAQLHELIAHVEHRVRVHDDWGFARRHPRPAGIAVLFSGPPGTGKTMAAGVVARRLGLDLFRVDLASVVSKYVGETERNLEAVFNSAEDSDAIVFFDEADALFGKRTQVRDAHDRYANLETSYLLQRIEDHDGMVILASNLPANIDEAFARRMRFTLEFPFPGANERRRLWEWVWPAELPRDDALDAGVLAERFELSGGSIRSVALSAAFLAAADGGVVRREHVLHAVRREYQKTRRVLRDDALQPEAR